MNKSFVFVAALALLAGAVDGVFLRKRVESDHDVEEIVKPKQSLRRESQVVMNMGTRESVESKKSWKSWMNGKSTRKTYNARKYTCDWENRVECIDTTKKRSYRRETRIAICHYDKWRGDYETRCIKECDIDKHLKHFEDDYCGECIEDELSATKAPNKNANKCNCYSDCDDHDLCTIDQIIHENNEHFCVHTPKICVEGYSCNPADGECSTQTVPVECDDNDPCTIDKLVWESNEESCTHTPKVCPDGYKCNPTDGECIDEDQLIPCIAVIDEDDTEFTTQAATWNEFRTGYPFRPFCLLDVYRTDNLIVNVPPNFMNDSNALLVPNVTRDEGNPALTEDWAKKCGIDSYLTSNIEFVGLFVDISPSMPKGTVGASYNKFMNDMNTSGIEVRCVHNTNENWILPFMATLVPGSAGEDNGCI